MKNSKQNNYWVSNCTHGVEIVYEYVETVQNGEIQKVYFVLHPRNRYLTRPMELEFFNSIEISPIFII